MSDMSANKNKYSFTWSIEEFSGILLTYFDTDEIRSPLFTTDHIGPASWFLTIRGIRNNGTISRGECSLVRYSQDEGPDTIQIQWQLKVASKNKRYLIEDMRDVAIIDGFKKGYSCTWCGLYGANSVFDTDLVTLECQMTEYSPVEKPVSKSSVVLSKLEAFLWYPQYLSETKLLRRFQNTQFELFFHVSDENKLVRIRRSDNNHLIMCYVSCGLCINEVKKNALSASKNRFLKPFEVNDTYDVSCSVNNLSDKKFNKNELRVKGYVITSVLVEDKCSTLAGKLSNVNGINSTLKLDSADLFENNVRVYEDKKHTDIQLKIGCESFPAHKCFLSARSPVFSAMFDQDMVENQTGSVNFTDMDANTLKLLLKYIYTSTIEELHCENALKLLTAAEKYQIHSLKEKCAAYLLDNLSEENICEVLVVADMISYNDLKKSVFDYVKSNAKKVLLSDSWKQFVKENINLAAETLIMISEEFGTAK